MSRPMCHNLSAFVPHVLVSQLICRKAMVLFDMKIGADTKQLGIQRDIQRRHRWRSNHCLKVEVGIIKVHDLWVAGAKSRWLWEKNRRNWMQRSDTCREADLNWPHLIHDVLLLHFLKPRGAEVGRTYPFIAHDVQWISHGLRGMYQSPTHAVHMNDCWLVFDDYKCWNLVQKDNSCVIMSHAVSQLHYNIYYRDPLLITHEKNTDPIADIANRSSLFIIFQAVDLPISQVFCWIYQGASHSSTIELISSLSV